MTFYGKRGSPYQIYFCVCPWVKISLGRYLFERFIMFNPCIATEPQLKIRGFELHQKIERKYFSLNDKEELERIKQLI